MKKFKKPIDVAFSLFEKQRLNIDNVFLGKDDVLLGAPWYLKYFLKRKIQKLESQGPLPKTPEQWTNALFPGQKESFERFRTHIICDRIRTQVEEIFEKKIIKKTIENEFKLWMIHMWFIQRRFLFEKDKHLPTVLMDAFWINCQAILERYDSPINIRDLHKLFYGMIEILDTSIEEPNDTKIADLIFELFKFESSYELYKWVRFIRFENYFFDHMDLNTLGKGRFFFILPNDPLFNEIETE